MCVQVSLSLIHREFKAVYFKLSLLLDYWYPVYIIDTSCMYMCHCMFFHNVVVLLSMCVYIFVCVCVSVRVCDQFQLKALILRDSCKQAM